MGAGRLSASRKQHDRRCSSRLALAPVVRAPRSRQALRLSTRMRSVSATTSPANLDRRVRRQRTSPASRAGRGGEEHGGWRRMPASLAQARSRASKGPVRLRGRPRPCRTADHCGGRGIPIPAPISLGGKVSGLHDRMPAFGVPGVGTFEGLCTALPAEVFEPFGVVGLAPSRRRRSASRAVTHHSVHIRHCPGVTYRKVGVSLKGRPVHVANGRTAIVNLRGLAKAATPLVKATTTTSSKIRGARASHACAKGPIQPKRHARL